MSISKVNIVAAFSPIEITGIALAMDKIALAAKNDGVSIKDLWADCESVMPDTYKHIETLLIPYEVGDRCGMIIGNSVSGNLYMILAETEWIETSVTHPDTKEETRLPYDTPVASSFNVYLMSW